ncbi:MAG: holo-ACP synthase [Acidobacteriota bacterium]
MIVGLGIDLLEICRMERTLARSGDRFLARVFTAAERDACEALGGGAARWAARFAAKEAVMKALGTGWSRGVTWHDVEIVRAPAGAPQVRLSGVARSVARTRGAGVCHVTLTHARSHAAAVAVLEAGGGAEE